MKGFGDQGMGFSFLHRWLLKDPVGDRPRVADELRGSKTVGLERVEDDDAAPLAIEGSALPLPDSDVFLRCDDRLLFALLVLCDFPLPDDFELREECDEV